MSRAGSASRRRDSIEEAISASGGRSSSAGFLSPERLDEVDSTNSQLLLRAAAGAPEGTVLVAEHQREGRGRLGRRWHDGAGSSLLCSLLFRPRWDVTRFHLAPTVVALAVLESARNAGAELSCKWPNDLVDAAGRKAGGILAEVAPGGALVVGLGLNCGRLAFSEQTDGEPPVMSATSLEEVAGRDVEREEVLSSLLAAVSRRWLRLGPRESAPYAEAADELMDEYRRNCATLGARVRAEVAGRVVVGLATEVASDGSLVIVAGDEHLVVSAGDVVHLRTVAPGGEG